MALIALISKHDAEYTYSTFEAMRKHTWHKPGLESE